MYCSFVYCNAMTFSMLAYIVHTIGTRHMTELIRPAFLLNWKKLPIISYVLDFYKTQ